MCGPQWESATLTQKITFFGLQRQLPVASCQLASGWPGGRGSHTLTPPTPLRSATAVVVAAGVSIRIMSAVDVAGGEV